MGFERFDSLSKEDLLDEIEYALHIVDHMSSLDTGCEDNECGFASTYYWEKENELRVVLGECLLKCGRVP